MAKLYKEKASEMFCYRKESARAFKLTLVEREPIDIFDGFFMVKGKTLTFRMDKEAAKRLVTSLNAWLSEE